MNKWKIAFFLLAALIITAVIGLAIWITRPAPSADIPAAEAMTKEADRLTVTATKEDLQGIANTYIAKAIGSNKIPIDLFIEDDVLLTSELTVFAVRLPVIMHFEPSVLEDGNLILKQKSVEVGNLNIPPSTVLKLMGDTVALPSWMIVRPKEEELFIDLSRLPVSGDVKVRATKIDLPGNDIELEIMIPRK
ncbi:YpmS family protein [Bhargavaea cecembensis]|uniref:YpmS family protein n=1 Tax=Bhargavaea cecembensis TaxID=394098 RepID=UPI00058D1A4E|nr:YpmS family protein [Bhargavaea cecembensis]